MAQNQSKAQALRYELGLARFMHPELEWTNSSPLVIEVANNIRANAVLVKALLNFTVKDEMHDIQLIHQLLDQIGVKATSTRCRVKGMKSPPRVYRIDWAYWHKPQGYRDPVPLSRYYLF